MNKTIDMFRVRRRERLARRMDAEGWVTTKSGHKIHVNENGYIDMGSPFTRGGMGKPKGKSIPKFCKSKKQIKPIYSYSKDSAKNMGEIIAHRSEKDCVFGGFYKVEIQKTKSTERHIFFNPWTSEYFPIVINGGGKTSNYKNEYVKQMGLIPISREVSNLYFNTPQIGPQRYDARKKDGESRSGKSDSGNYHIPYGIAEGLGLDTDGMTPTQVWDMLAGKYGILPGDCYDKLEDGKKLEAKKLVKKGKGKVNTLMVTIGKDKTEKVEYRDLKLKQRYYGKGGPPEWELYGTRDYKKDRDKTDILGQFYTKEDLIRYLKDNGITEFNDGGNTINPQEADIPQYIGGTEERKFTKVFVKKGKDGFDISAEYLDGSKHKIDTAPSVKVAKDIIEKKYSVPRSKVTITKKTLESDRERNGWARENDGSVFTDGDKTIGKLFITHERPDTDSSFKVEGTDSNDEAYEKEFSTLDDAVKFLKEKGVKKATYGDSEIDPSIYKAPKVIFKSPYGGEYTSLMIESSGYKSVALMGVGTDGKKTKITVKSAYTSMKDFESLLQKYGLSLDDKRITISDDAKQYIDSTKVAENAEGDRLSRRKKKIDEEKETARKKNDEARSNPEYHDYMGVGLFKDYKIAIDEKDKRVYLYGTNPLGVTRCITYRPYTTDDGMDKEIEYFKTDMRQIKADASICEYDGGGDYGTYKDESGKSHKLSRAPSIEFVYDKVPGRKVLMQFDDGGVEEKEFDTESEAREFIKKIGSNSYIGENDYQHFFGKTFSPYKAPKIRHATIKKHGTSYTLVGDSNEYGTAHQFASGTREECEKVANDNGVKTSRITYDIPVPNDDVPRKSKAKSLKSFDEARHKMIKGTALDKRSVEDKELLTEIAFTMLSKGTYCMHRNPEKLENIFDSHFENLLESGTSGGSASPWLRRGLENRVFGTSTELSDVPAEDREKYGYLGDESILHKPQKTQAEWYGSMNVVFKKDRVEDRSTYSFGDSLDSVIPTVGYAGKKPTVEGFSGMSDDAITRVIGAYSKYKNGGSTFSECMSEINKICTDNYIEIQYHDILTLEDVEQLQFKNEQDIESAFGKISHDKLAKMMGKFEEWGTKIVYDNNGEWADGVEYIKKKYGV